MLERSCRKSSCPRCSITCFLTERWKVKSNSSSVLRAGNRAARMRASPPCASREDCSVESSAWRTVRSSTPPCGAFGELGERPRGGGRLQRAEQMRQLRAGAHAISPSYTASARCSTTRSRSGSRRRCLSARACSSAVIVRFFAKHRSWRHASSPVSSATATISRCWRGPRPYARPSWGRASSRSCRTADADRAAPGHPAAVDVGSRSGSARITSRSSISRSIGGRAASCACGRSPSQTTRRAAAGSRAVREAGPARSSSPSSPAAARRSPSPARARLAEVPVDRQSPQNPA